MSVLVATEIWDRTRSNGLYLKLRRFLLSIWKPFFTVRITKYWPRLPREIVKSLSLEISKSHLDMVLSNGVSVALLEHWVRKVISRVPSNLILGHSENCLFRHL